MAGRKLPVELYSILHAAYPKPNHLLLNAAQRQARFSSTLSASAPHALLELNSRSNTARKQDQAALAASTSHKSVPVANLFESVDDDYVHVPLSTLDHPAPPRSASEALLSLLASQSFEAADALLADLTASKEHVEPHLVFAGHARRLLESPAAGSDASAWLRWWALAPSVVDLHRSVPWPRTFLPAWERSKKGVRSMVAHLLQTTEGEGGVDLRLLDAFARVLCDQGFVKIVAIEVLPHMAAFAPTEQSEQLWQACLDAVRHREDPSELGAQSAWASKGLERGEDVRSATRFSVEWFEAHERDAAIALKRARAKMIRIHANLGRLELATQLALDSGLALLPSTRHLQRKRIAGAGRVPAFTLLRLLSLTALSDRYDLFTRLYEAFIADGRTLTRTERAELSQRMPYLARAAAAERANPAVNEAFTTYRYASFASEIEEGGGAEDQASAAVRATRDSLQAALDAGNTRKAGSILIKALKTKMVLPLDSAAQFIALAGKTEGFEAVLDSLDELFTVQREGLRSWMSGYWATASMLAHNRSGEYDSSLALFFNLFNVEALPKQVGQAKARLGDDAERWQTLPGSKGRIEQLVPDAHTFAIALQALVPRLSQPTVTEDEDGRQRSQPAPEADIALLDALLQSLLHEPIDFPLRTRNIEMSRDTKRRAPIDAYTFLPFFQMHARLQRPAVGLVELAGQLQERGVQVPAHHWAVVLGAFAAQAKEADLFYLLDLLEGRETRESAAKASAEMREATSSLSWPSPASPREGEKEKVGVVGYTAILAGLQKCGEVQVAKRVRARMGGRELVGRLDERFGVVWRRLMRQGAQQQ